MTLSSSLFSVLLVSSDADIQNQLRQVFKDATVIVARDASSLTKDLAKRKYDAIVVETKSGSLESGTLPAQLDTSHALLIAGSKATLKRTSKFLQSLNRPKAGINGQAAPSLEDFLEWKMGDFVKGMRNGSGRNLHPMLISAVERPLIARALQETKGNQIQAAELLGLNRNTLRKKIHELHIPIKRGRIAAVREA
ncbi:MAG TPA: helix-turn-helix domain-containing protein [Nitrospira sp.]|nr:helix-turn-helix domain-containing protein [Nitrospira sp.]